LIVKLISLQVYEKTLKQLSASFFVSLVSVYRGISRAQIIQQDAHFLKSIYCTLKCICGRNMSCIGRSSFR